MAIFELFRLSLTERSIQGELFKEPVEDITRERYLKNIFSKTIQFIHNNTEFHYVPDVPGNSNDNFIFGRVGRSYIIEENRPPEEGLEESEHMGWKASVIVIDPTSHSDGQKISFQFDRSVGTPSSLIKSIIDKVNLDNYSKYHIDSDPIFSSKTFWDFVDQNKGEVTTVKFDISTPNMFGSSDEFSKEMKRFRDYEKAQKVELSLKSSDGLQTDTQGIRQAVEYTEKGTGTIKATTRSGKSYNSLNTTAKVEIKIPESGLPILDKIANLISEVMGRE